MSRDPADGIRVLLVGWVNAPHVRLWTQTLVGLGHEVHLAGRVASNWPDEPPVPGVFSVAVLDVARAPIWRGLSLSRQLRRAAELIDPELVHAHWLPEAGWMAAREGLAPLITSAWGSDVLGAGALARRRSRRAAQASDLVLADSAPLAEAVRALAGSEVPVSVVRWGIDLARFRPAGSPAEARAELGWPEAPTVVCTRALTPLYNPDAMLDAIAAARRSVPDLRLVLKHPGTGTPAAVRDAIAERRLDEVVTVLGHVPAGDLPRIYRAADAVLSIPSSDSSPRSVWEALACGAPVVASDLPWARDELRDGVDVRLVPPVAEPVAEVLVELLRDADAARRLGTAGRVTAERTVDPDEQARRIDELYRTVARRA